MSMWLVWSLWLGWAFSVGALVWPMRQRLVRGGEMSGWNPVPRLISRGSQEGRDVGPALHERPKPECLVGCRPAAGLHRIDCPRMEWALTHGSGPQAAGCPPPESSQ